MTVSRDQTLEWIKTVAKVLNQNRDYLTQLDAAIGDADHGANMDRGFKKVIEKMPEFADKDIGTVFKSVGMNLISTVGGAGGPLYGTFFLQMGMKSAGKMELNLEDWTAALEAGLGGVIMRGKAEPPVLCPTLPFRIVKSNLIKPCPTAVLNESPPLGRAS